MTKWDLDRFEKWLDCEDKIREVNREKRFAEFMKDQYRKGYMQPKSIGRPDARIP